MYGSPGVLARIDSLSITTVGRWEFVNRVNDIASARSCGRAELRSRSSICWPISRVSESMSGLADSIGPPSEIDPITEPEGVHTGAAAQASVGQCVVVVLAARDEQCPLLHHRGAQPVGTDRIFGVVEPFCGVDAVQLPPRTAVAGAPGHDRARPVAEEQRGSGVGEMVLPSVEYRVGGAAENRVGVDLGEALSTDSRHRR